MRPENSVNGDTTRMNSNIRVRPCGAGDETALALIGQATFLETFAGVIGGKDIVAHCANAHGVDLYRLWLMTSGYALWLAECSPGDAPIGYMVIAPPQLPLPDTAGDLELKRIYLLSRFQGGGLGKQLVAAAVAHSRACGARRLLLGVYSGNQRAIAFYERVGFIRLGDRKFRVGGKDYDDNIMGLSLQT